jgi:hypothetical protein
MTNGDPIRGEPAPPPPRPSPPPSDDPPLKPKEPFSRFHGMREWQPFVQPRLADARDEIGVLELCQMAHAEIGFYPISMPKVAALVRLAITRERGIIAVIGEPHNLKAILFLLMEPVWYSEQFVLMEFVNYVRPDARRSTYAKDLIAYAKKLSRETKLPLFVGVSTDKRTEAKMKLYRRMLPWVGGFFLYRPEMERQGADRASPATAAE